MTTKPSAQRAAVPDKLEGSDESDEVADQVTPPPDGLKDAGRRLRVSVLSGWEIDAWEQLLLLQACRCADRLDELAEIASTATAVVTNAKGDATPHPAIVEARQQSVVLTRLLASLRLPAGDEDDLGRPQRRGAARGAYAARRAR